MADSRERAVWPPGSHSSQNSGLFECCVKGTCGPTTALCRVLPAVTWYLWKFLDSSLFQTSEAVSVLLKRAFDLGTEKVNSLLDVVQCASFKHVESYFQ